MTARGAPGEVSDGALARRISGGPAGATNAEESELYRRFAPRVRFYGLRHLGDEAAAQDLAQEVLLLTIEQLRAGKIREPDQIGSFILGTSRMMATARRRQTRRRQALDARFVPAILHEPAPDHVHLDQVRLERCLGTLGERDRAVLVMTFYADRTSQQVGAALGMPSGAVRVARHRALSRLRQCVLGKGIGDDEP